MELDRDLKFYASAAKRVKTKCFSGYFLELLEFVAGPPTWETFL